MSKNTPLISFKNVSINYNKTEILKEIDFEIFEKEFIFLIGNVGTGKTTLLKTMYSEIPIKKGKAEVLYFNLRKIKKKEIPWLRRKIGFIFQDFQLLIDRNVFENLKFVLEATGWTEPDKIQERIKLALKDVNMTDKELSMPLELSGGEKQRVMIARALLNNPKLILADEPTGNLDPEDAIKITTILNNLTKKGTAVLFATHNYNLMKNYNDRVLKVENGKIKILKISS